MPQFKKAKSSNWIESDQFNDFPSDKFEENPVTEPNKAVKHPALGKLSLENYPQLNT